MPDEKESSTRLVAWGANSYGQLGCGHANEQETTPVLLATPSDMTFSSVHGGGGHSLVVGADRKSVWATGWNTRGQLGLGHRSTEPERGFQRVPLPFEASIESVACGWDFSLIVADGRVYGAGSNTFGQLGLGEECLGVDGFAALPGFDSGSRVTSVSCGLRHALFLLADGRLRGCGSNKRGQLGQAEEKTYWECQSISGLPADVTSIHCGQHFSAVLTSAGELYAFGDNKHGQLGDGPAKDVRMMHLPSPTKSVACGWTHMAVLLADGTVHCWGRNDYGQLGRPDGPAVATAEKCVGLACGSEHALALDDGGVLLSWGWNEHGNCGDGTTNNVHVPKVVKLPASVSSVTSFATASGHSFALVKVRPT